MQRISGSLDPSKNPSWPPKIGKYIITHNKVESLDYIYFGKIIKILEGNKGIIINLVNGFEYPHLDDAIKLYIPASADPKKYMLVIETSGWKYVSDKAIQNTINNDYKYKQNVGEFVYDDIRSHPSTLSNKYYHKASEDPDTNVSLHDLIISQDLDDFSFLQNDSKNYDKYLPHIKTTLDDEYAKEFARVKAQMKRGWFLKFKKKDQNQY